MPGIPQVWLEEFVVNLTTAGNQDDPDIVQLANGNILVAWTTDNDTGAGSPSEPDIIGQIFDPIGNRIGVEFRINAGSFFSDNENNVDLAALPNGGFVAVYQDVDVATSLRLIQFDAAGVVVSTTFAQQNIVEDLVAGGDSYRNPQIAVSNSTQAIVVYEETTGGVTSVQMRTYNPTAQTFGAQDLIMFDTVAPAIATLSNGDIVIVGTRPTAGDSSVIMRILNPDGTNQLGFTTLAGTAGDGFNDNDVSVAALAGGGYVVVYTDRDATDTDTSFQIFTNAGVLVTAALNVQGGTNNDNEAVVAGLTDGTFVIAYDDDTDNTIEVTHYSAAGAVLGRQTVSGSGQEIAIRDFGDGRFAVTWESTLAGGELRMEILDTRDFVNPNGVYSPDQWQIGTIGNDVFTADNASEFVTGHDGNDTITESGQIRSYFGGNGNDTLNVASPINDDVHDGGAGNDTIDWSLSGVVGGAFNLITGLATAGGQDEIMVGFENITGTNNADSIVGDNFVNTLSGGLGNDAINGRGGDDSLLGGGGNDTLIGSIGRDALNGGADTDTASYAGAAAAVRAFLANAPQNNGEAAGDTYVSIENLTGTGFDDTLVGNAVANTIRGGAGVDRMNGLEGADILFGDGGNDIFLFSSVAHTLPGAGNRDTVRDFEDAGDNDTIDLSGFAGVLTFVGAGAFTAAQQVRAFQSGADVLIQINTAGNFNPESEILLFNTAIAQVNAADFVL